MFSACAQNTPTAQEKPADNGDWLASSGPCQYETFPAEAELWAYGDGTFMVHFNSPKVPYRIVQKNVILNHALTGEATLPAWMYTITDGNCDAMRLKPVIRTEEYFAITDSVIRFTSEGQIEPGDAEKIKTVAAAFGALKADYPKIELFLNGHTDKSRSAEYSLAIGEQYANRVKNMIAHETGNSANMGTRSWGSEAMKNISPTLPANRVTMTVKLNQN